jgi:hypothetical protein
VQQLGARCGDREWEGEGEGSRGVDPWGRTAEALGATRGGGGSRAACPRARFPVSDPNEDDDGEAVAVAGVPDIYIDRVGTGGR